MNLPVERRIVNTADSTGHACSAFTNHGEEQKMRDDAATTPSHRYFKQKSVPQTHSLLTDETMASERAYQSAGDTQ